MHRRLFLQSFAAWLGLGAVAPAIQASSVNSPVKSIELQRSKLAGFQYHQGEVIWSMLTLGAALDLIREPDNRHDARAVRVEWQGHKLGYVSRIDNAAISHLLDNGQAVRAEVVALQVSDDPWKRVGFAVYFGG